MSSSLRRAVTLASLCLCGVLAVTLATAKPGAAAPPPPTSVAIVDLAKLTASLDEAKLLRDQVVKQKDDSMALLQVLKDELASVTKDLDQLPKEKKGTPEFLKMLAHKYELEATLKARGESLQQLLDIAEGENMKIMFAKVVDAVGRLGAEKAYDLILWDDRNIVAPVNPATGAQVWSVIRDRRILYAATRLDITGDVLLMMNTEFKAVKK